MTNCERAYIALGSNLGDRRSILRSAVRALEEWPEVTVIAVSTIRETLPVGPPGQGPFLNCVAGIATSLEPRAVLAGCLAIEVRHGRRRADEERWGPRRLDLDLLLHGDRVIDEPGLTVPHPRLHERLFVLEPLAEIAAAVVHPVLGLSLESLRQGLGAGERSAQGGRNQTCDGSLPTSS